MNFSFLNKVTPFVNVRIVSKESKNMKNKFEFNFEAWPKQVAVV